MKTSLLYLALSAALTGLLWLPYVIDRLRPRGLADTLGSPERPPPPSAWAARLQKAHANAVENLSVFATLVLVSGAAGVADAAVGTAAAVYFRARLVHALPYALAVRGLRTLAFGVGFAAQAVAWRLLAAA